MLAIRMQRTGRKGHAQFRVVVQDARLTPTSGRVVARLGNYNPHTKTAALDKEKAAFYLEHGAQPSDRVVSLLKTEGVKLPKWVQAASDKKRAIRNPEKLRKNRSAEEKPTEKPAEEAPESPEAPESKAEQAEPTEEKPAEEPKAENPAEETPEEPKPEKK